MTPILSTLSFPCPSSRTVYRGVLLVWFGFFVALQILGCRLPTPAQSKIGAPRVPKAEPSPPHKQPEVLPPFSAREQADFRSDSKHAENAEKLVDLPSSYAVCQSLPSRQKKLVSPASGTDLPKKKTRTSRRKKRRRWTHRPWRRMWKRWSQQKKCWRYWQKRWSYKRRKQRRNRRISGFRTKIGIKP